jgi:hypothetical protein
MIASWEVQFETTEMGKYGEAAVLAVQLYKEGIVSGPLDAWERAVSRVFPASTAQQDKGCPKGAFLGLCCDGLIEGIPQGAYSRSSKNKQYALKAIEILHGNKFLRIP